MGDTHRYAFGLDIGGTKCAVILGELLEDSIRVIAKEKIATADFREPQSCLDELCNRLERLIGEYRIKRDDVSGVGISCGGPLDSVRGIVQSPPNLPGWDEIHAVELVTRRTGFAAQLENDANACAIAEWRYGAGRGVDNMVFLTFGTGLGAGIIAGGRLISGGCGMAGECGHIRLASDGPTGYGKAGSFEGFCSGGGIAKLGRLAAQNALAGGRPLGWCRSAADLDKITAKLIADAAENGDAAAREVYRESAAHLGAGLAILIDILNPERIVIGSVFARSESLFRQEMEAVIRREALPQSSAICQVVPAQLGEMIGDIASLSVAFQAK